MAKANAITGGSMWLPAGTPAPDGWNPETGPRLTGPGGAAAEQAYKEQAGKLSKTSRPAADPESQVEVQDSADQPDSSSEQAVAEQAAPERPAGNAAASVWREYVAALEGRQADDERYFGKSRADLMEMVDTHNSAAAQRTASHRDNLSPDQQAADEDQPLAGRPASDSFGTERL